MHHQDEAARGGARALLGALCLALACSAHGAEAHRAPFGKLANGTADRSGHAHVRERRSRARDDLRRDAAVARSAGSCGSGGRRGARLRHRRRLRGPPQLFRRDHRPLRQSHRRCGLRSRGQALLLFPRTTSVIPCMAARPGSTSASGGSSRSRAARRHRCAWRCAAPMAIRVIREPGRRSDVLAGRRRLARHRPSRDDGCADGGEPDQPLALQSRRRRCIGGRADGVADDPRGALHPGGLGADTHRRAAARRGHAVRLQIAAPHRRRHPRRTGSPDRGRPRHRPQLRARRRHDHR